MLFIMSEIIDIPFFQLALRVLGACVCVCVERGVRGVKRDFTTNLSITQVLFSISYLTRWLAGLSMSITTPSSHLTVPPSSISSTLCA